MKHNFTLLCLLFVTTLISCKNEQMTETEIMENEISQTEAVGEAATTSSVKIGGTYSYGDDVEKGPVGTALIFPVDENTVLFSLDISKGAPSYNMGKMEGKMKLNGNVGTYESDLSDSYLNCSMIFEFFEDKLSISYNNEKQECGFGNGVSADTNYFLVDKTIPTHYFTGEGDEIPFETLAKELSE